MPTTTTDQLLRLPIGTDDPDVVDDLTQLTAQVESRLVLRYASVAQRTARNPAPAAGQVSVTTDTQTLWLYTGSSWAQIYPLKPAILSGTTTPSNSLGSDGDIYIKY